MQRTRWGLGAALVGILALSGCTEIGSLSDKAQIDLALSTLSTELDELAGIQTESTAELQGDFTYSVAVHATVPQLDTDLWAAVAMLVRDDLGEGAFERNPATFDLSVPEGTILSIWSFDLSDDELLAAVDLAVAVGEAYGAPPTLSIGDGVGMGVLSAAADPDWDAIRVLVDDSPADQYWQLPGLSWEGEMPPSPVTDLVDNIAEVVPVGFDSELYVELAWSSVATTVTFAAAGVDVADPTTSSRWPEATQIAALLEAAGLPASSFMFYGLDGQGTAVVAIGACSDAVTFNDGDALLATALAGAGVAAAPGQCLTA